LGENFSTAALGKYSCSYVKAKNTLKRICTIKRVKGEGCINDRTINGEKIIINGVNVTTLLLVAIVGCHCSEKKNQTTLSPI
jgi:hypothetical protein